MYKISQKAAKIDPGELQQRLHNELNISLIPDIDSEENKAAAITLMSRMTAYISYFTEMEVLTRNMKRATTKKEEPELYTTLISNEEIYGAYKDICKQTYDATAKLMTMKRLALDEAKLLGR